MMPIGRIQIGRLTNAGICIQQPRYKGDYVCYVDRNKREMNVQNCT
jgi:hypothetical protein